MDFNGFLESINQNITEALYRSNDKGFLYVNRAYADMFGFKDELEALSTHPNKVYKNPEQRKKLVEKLRKHGKYENLEVEFVRRDGSPFIGLISAVMVHANDGTIYWDGSIRDITNQRGIINKLLDREQLLDSINRNINEAIYRSRMDGGLIYVNDEFVKMFGYPSAEELLKNDVSDLYKDPAERKAVGNVIFEMDAISNKEVEFKRKDGTTFWGYLNSHKVSGQDGEVYFDGAIRDITKEKEADELRRKQAEMQEILIYISSGLMNLPIEEIGETIELSLQGLGEFVEADRTYIFEFNDDNTSMEIFSWVREGVPPIKKIKNKKVLKEQVRSHLEVLRRGSYFALDDTKEMEEGPLQKVYKRQKVKSLINVPLIKDSRIVGCIGFDWVNQKHKVSEVEKLLLQLFSEMYINVMDRTMREKELRILVQKTIEQNQRLKDFSYITSHNFRSSVANLMGLITVLEEDRANEQFFQMMKDTALKLNLAIDSINDLLNFEKDLSALERKDCYLLEAVTDIIILNKKTARDKDISFDVDIPQKLKVRVLPAYLQSILLNLITNAMKYGVTQEKRNIHIKAEKEAELVVLTVADEGVGIDMERFGRKLFRLGSRFHAQMATGQGMGLYITKQQVEAIGGRIEVESELNKGTKFKVYLNAE